MLLTYCDFVTEQLRSDGNIDWKYQIQTQEILNQPDVSSVNRNQSENTPNFSGKVDESPENEYVHLLSDPLIEGTGLNIENELNSNIMIDDIKIEANEFIMHDEIPMHSACNQSNPVGDDLSDGNVTKTNVKIEEIELPMDDEGPKSRSFNENNTGLIQSPNKQTPTGQTF